MVPGNDNNPDEGGYEGWDEPTLPPADEIDLDATAAPVDDSPPSALPAQSGWFTPAAADLEHHEAGRSARRVPLRVWAALAALAAVTIGVIALTHPDQQGGPRARGVSATASPPAAATAAASDNPCTGLSGTVVTTQAGQSHHHRGHHREFRSGLLRRSFRREGHRSRRPGRRNHRAGTRRRHRVDPAGQPTLRRDHAAQREHRERARGRTASRRQPHRLPPGDQHHHPPRRCRADQPRPGAGMTPAPRHTGEATPSTPAPDPALARVRL